MYLKRCEILNFRSIKNIIIKFNNNFQTLVGLNESGKSNILRALSYINNDIQPIENDIRDPRHDEDPISEAYIRYIFGFSNEDTLKIYDKLKALFLFKSDNPKIVKIDEREYSLFEFCSIIKEGLYTINLIDKNKLSQYWRLSKNSDILKKIVEIPENWIKVRDNNNMNVKYVCGDEYPEYEDLQSMKKLSVNDIHAIIGKELNSFIDNNLLNCIIWKYNEANLLPARINIDTFSGNPDSCIPLRNIFYLSGYDDIPKAISDSKIKINGMTNLLRRLSELSTEHLHRVWPEYKKISIHLNQNGNEIETGIADEFNIFSFERRSDGFKRFITFLFLISAETKANYLYDTIILMDEPDIGLHPSSIQFLRDELIKISKQNYVIVATHSIFMIDKDRIDRHIIVKKDKEESVTISGYNSDMLDEEVIYKALGFSFFEMLKQKNMIFEGWTDKYTFYCWINSSKADSKIKRKFKNYGMLHAFGAKDVQRVAMILENFNREYFIISDSDTTALEYKKKFNGKYQWLTYNDLGFTNKTTIEDFLEENYVISKIKETLRNEQFNSNYEIPSKSTFNQKLIEVLRNISIDKQESDRLKRMIKNNIFDNLKTRHIQLDDLFSAIDKNIS